MLYREMPTSPNVVMPGAGGSVPYPGLGGVPRPNTIPGMGGAVPSPGLGGVPTIPARSNSPGSLPMGGGGTAAAGGAPVPAGSAWSQALREMMANMPAERGAFQLAFRQLLMDQFPMLATVLPSPAAAPTAPSPGYTVPPGFPNTPPFSGPLPPPGNAPVPAPAAASRPSLPSLPSPSLPPIPGSNGAAVNPGAGNKPLPVGAVRLPNGVIRGDWPSTDPWGRPLNPGPSSPNFPSGPMNIGTPPNLPIRIR